MIEGGDYTSSMAIRDRGWRLYVEGSSRGGDYTSRARRGVAIIRRGLVEALSLTFIFYICLGDMCGCFLLYLVFVVMLYLFVPSMQTFIVVLVFFIGTLVLSGVFFHFLYVPSSVFFPCCPCLFFHWYPCVIWCFLSFFCMSPHLFFSLPSKVFLLIHLVCRGAGRPPKKNTWGSICF